MPTLRSDIHGNCVSRPENVDPGDTGSYSIVVVTDDLPCTPLLMDGQGNGIVHGRLARTAPGKRQGHKKTRRDNR
jgi:hypothetical protein